MMKEYPRTESYDKDWINENRMGPNPILLMEELCGNLDLRTRRRVSPIWAAAGIVEMLYRGTGI